MSFRSLVSSSTLVRAVAIAAVAVSFSSVHAQQVTGGADKMFALNEVVGASLPEFRYKSEAVSSNVPDAISSSVAATSADEDATDASQPPPRRRVYGRPKYADRLHNPDGSTRFAFEAGGGFATPAGSTAKYNTTSFKFSVGGGLNFNKKFGVLLQFDYDKLGLTSGNLNNLYNAYSAVDPQSDYSGLDANAHVWSFSVNPIYNFYTSDTFGAYVVGGVGYYRKGTNFTLPGTGTYCDFYGFCYQYSANQTFDSYSNGAFGANGGLGLTYKISHFGNQKLFAEARYQWVNNQFKPNDFYFENSYRTGYFPVTFGVRW